MPCDSSHMEPTAIESEASKIASFFDEIRTGQLNKHHYNGYHPAAYCASLSRKMLDNATASLCAHLRKLTPDAIQKYSLEMQTWWRDHQAADKAKQDAANEPKIKIEGTKTINWTRPMLGRFRVSYNAAVKAGVSVFKFDDNEFVTGYAKYLIEHLDNQFKN